MNRSTPLSARHSGGVSRIPMMVLALALPLLAQPPGMPPHGGMPGMPPGMPPQPGMPGGPQQPFPFPLIDAVSVNLAAKRSNVFPFQPVELTLTVANGTDQPTAPISRSDLVAPKRILCAGPPNEDVNRKGVWVDLDGALPAGSIGALQPGESFTLPLRIALPEEVTSRGMPAYLQWVGRGGSLEGIRSNELMLTLQQGDKPVATLETTKGIVVLELWPDKAPNHVANFIELAEKGFYDGLKFHRVKRNFMVQTGCPRGDGSSGPGYTIAAEFNDTDFKKGILGMARLSTGNDTAGSQFFVCVADSPTLNKEYTAFGRVLEGQEIADAISMVPVKVEKPIEDVVIRKLTVNWPKSYERPAVKKAEEQVK